MKHTTTTNLYRKVSVHTLHVLIAIDEHGSFSRAAEQVNLVVSAVSRRIQELEEMLGVSLLQRTSHQIRFTDAGKIVLKRARQILLEVDGLAFDLESVNDGLCGEVSLGVSFFSLFDTLPSDLGGFNQAYPSLKVSLQNMTSQQVIEALLHKKIDVGIFTSRQPPAGLDTALYYEDRLVVLAPINHPLAHHSTLTLAQVAPYDLIGPPLGSETDKLLTEQFKQLQTPLKMSTRVASLAAMMLLTQAGLGLSIVPGGISQRLGPVAEIVKIPISLSEPWASQCLYVGIVSDTPPNSAAQRLYKHLGRFPG